MNYQQHALDWIDAWNDHDVEAILRLYAEDIEFTSPFVERVLGEANGSIRGKATLRTYFTKALGAYPSLHFTLGRVYAGHRSCVLEYQSVAGLRAAECLEFDAHGRICRTVAHYFMPESFPSA